MTPKDKAIELLSKFFIYSNQFYENDTSDAKQSALIAVDEIINENAIDECDLSYKRSFYWEEVKQEIQKL